MAQVQWCGIKNQISLPANLHNVGVRCCCVLVLMKQASTYFGGEKSHQYLTACCVPESVPSTS